MHSCCLCTGGWHGFIYFIIDQLQCRDNNSGWDDRIRIHQRFRGRIEKAIITVGAPS